MEAHSRTDRAAGVILAIEGSVFLAASAAVATTIGPFLDATEPAAQAQVPMILILNVLPAGIGGVLALLAAWRLWRARPGARSFAWGWAVIWGLVSAAMMTSYGSLAWVLQVLVFERDRARFDWPWFRHDPAGLLAAGTPLANLPGTRLDSIYLWFPAVVAIGAALVAGLLLAGWIARRTRGARPS